MTAPPSELTTQERIERLPDVRGWSVYLVGVYLRETKRRNKDGSVVSYLQLAHNERHPETGSPVAKIIHNFGRADQVDREALRRLVASISRHLVIDTRSS